MPTASDQIRIRKTLGKTVVLTASHAPAIPPAIMWVAKPTGIFLSFRDIDLSNRSVHFMLSNGLTGVLEW